MPGVGVVTNGAPVTLPIAPGATTAAVVRNNFVDVEVKGTAANADGLARTGADPRRLAAVGLLLVGLGVAVTAPGVARKRFRTSRR